MRGALLLFFLVAGLAGCGEPPARTDPEGVRAFGNETPQNPLYERTRGQGGL